MLKLHQSVLFSGHSLEYPPKLTTKIRSKLTTLFHGYFTAYIGRARPVMHLEHKAGDKMYIDFAGEKPGITDQQTGEIQYVEVFVAILGCSQLTYVEAVPTQRRQDFIGGLRECASIFWRCSGCHCTGLSRY